MQRVSAHVRKWLNSFFPGVDRFKMADQELYQKIPLEIRDDVYRAVETYQKEFLKSPEYSIKLRFEDEFCYFDYYINDKIFPRFRLRYLSEITWGLEYFRQSDQTYQSSRDMYGKELSVPIGIALQLFEPLFFDDRK